MARHSTTPSKASPRSPGTPRKRRWPRASSTSPRPLTELTTLQLEKDPAERFDAEARELAAEATSPRRETRIETVRQPVDPEPGPPPRQRIIAGTVATAVVVTMIALSGATHADTRADAAPRR
ncbi:hypothetical protein [Amycolatopsis rubida]|uniref:hypothetical protein n=1 Tax=Amycolatopsis rubida TaxID=112413 RepID=UPI000B8249A5|nr:hypothetical protein [Amycolatopsis rubida]